jgi:hypothetical protein
VGRRLAGPVFPGVAVVPTAWLRNKKVICRSGVLTELQTARHRGITLMLVVNATPGSGRGWPNLQRPQGDKPGDAAGRVRFGRTISLMVPASLACMAFG